MGRGAQKEAKKTTWLSQARTRKSQVSQWLEVKAKLPSSPPGLKKGLEGRVRPGQAKSLTALAVSRPRKKERQFTSVLWFGGTRRPFPSSDAGESWAGEKKKTKIVVTSTVLSGRRKAQKTKPPIKNYKENIKGQGIIARRRVATQKEKTKDARGTGERGRRDSPSF